ncbi:exported hypothetical protein [Xenorhabdus nematophila str. Anatoliense]|nr:exported hypothetical protein [Xenorhabdus nematophila str. Anatoliense]
MFVQKIPLKKHGGNIILILPFTPMSAFSAQAKSCALEKINITESA